MIKILICGIGGKMGATLLNLLSDDESAQAVCGVDINAAQNLNVPVYASFNDVNCQVDVVIDFSSPTALHGELEWAKSHNVPVVLASTGYSGGDMEYIGQCAEKIPLFRTANFSLGVNLLKKLVREAAETLGEKFDIEIIEKHHRLKKDAPSGTALMLAESANVGERPYVYGRDGVTGVRGREIGIHAVRGGTIVGEHEVIFAGEDEIITLGHSARSKAVFAAGAIAAAKWICGKPSGLYDMDDLLG